MANSGNYLLSAAKNASILKRLQFYKRYNALDFRSNSLSEVNQLVRLCGYRYLYTNREPRSTLAKLTPQEICCSQVSGYSARSAELEVYQESIVVRDSTGNLLLDLIQGTLGPLLLPIQKLIDSVLNALINFLNNVKYWLLYTIVGVVFTLLRIDAGDVAYTVQEVEIIVNEFFAVFTGTTLS